MMKSLFNWFSRGFRIITINQRSQLIYGSNGLAGISPINIVLELVVRGEGNNGPKTHGQREEALRDRGIPDLGLPEPMPGGCHEVQDAIWGTLERHSSHQQANHDDVGEEGEKVGRLAGTLHTAHDHTEHH